ncbi:MAG: hypothetical protein V4733_03985 [Verrucomicrobiota bacterium]
MASAAQGRLAQETFWREPADAFIQVDFAMTCNPPSPFLPAVKEPLDCGITRRHGTKRGSGFYHDALRYAQWQWISGKPAQAILQLNKAWMAEEPTPATLHENPPPFRALVWMMSEAMTGDCGFMGNPVRHFQHLATRVSGPRAEIRALRAWACFHLAHTVLPADGYPPDSRQLARDGIRVPCFPEVLRKLARVGWNGESTELARCFAGHL